MLQEIREHLAFIQYSEDGRARTDCPVCGGHNSFTAYKRDGRIVYNCYKASCTISGGATGYSRSLAEIISWRTQRQANDKPFELPTHFTSYKSSQSAVDYLRTNHCQEAVDSGLVQVSYDPRQDRVVFLIEDDNKVIDAVGRSLQKKVKPKWYRYGTSSVPLIVSKLGVDKYLRGVLVEDAASACAVSGVATGISLLGSTLSEEHLCRIIKFKEILVALDKDATKKALEIGTVLKAYTKCRVVCLPDDLKYFDTENITNILGLKENAA